jgi:hypothetical protein
MHVQLLRRVLTLDLDFGLVLLGGGEIVCKLHSQPRFLHAAECLRKPDSHLGADTGFSVNDVVKRLPGDAENICAAVTDRPSGSTQSCRTTRPGCTGFFMGMVVSPFF